MTALWVFFIIMMILFCLPLAILYFLPYGFITEKPFLQMPINIIIIVNAANFAVFCIPIIISIVLYIVLKNKVEKRQESHRKSSNLSIVHKLQHNNLSIIASSSYSLQDLPYPLNAPCNKDTAAGSKNISGQPELRGQPSGCIPADGNASNENDLEDSTVEKNTCVEIEAALKSMKTNLVMLLFFSVHCFIFLISWAECRILLRLSLESILKFLLPTVTMVANFGPVKDVAKIYINNLKAQLTTI